MTPSTVQCPKCRRPLGSKYRMYRHLLHHCPGNSQENVSSQSEDSSSLSSGSLSSLHSLSETSSNDSNQSVEMFFGEDSSDASSMSVFSHNAGDNQGADDQSFLESQRSIELMLSDSSLHSLSSSQDTHNITSGDDDEFYRTNDVTESSELAELISNQLIFAESDDHLDSDSSGGGSSTIHDLDGVNSRIQEQEDNANVPTPINMLEAQLLFLMTTHSIPLHVYPMFMKWGGKCQVSSFDFNKPNSFGSTMKRLTTHHSMSHNVPRIVSVSVPGIPKASIRVFPFLENAKQLYSNSKLMEDSLWRHDGNSPCYSELNTGNWWKNADSTLEQRLRKHSVSDVANHYVAPIIMFIDGTHCDRNGRLQAEPVLCSFGNIPLSQRKLPHAWFFLGLLPRKHGTPAERTAQKKGKGLRASLAERYHEALREIFSEIIAVQEKDRNSGLGVSMNVHGKGVVQLHFEFCLIIGDTVGHDALCCHTQAYSKRVPRPVRSCNVNWEDLDDPTVVCEFVSSDEIINVVESCMHNIKSRHEVEKNRELCRSLSQLLHVPIFNQMLFGGDKGGIFKATPFEVLHTLLLGILKYTLQSLYDYTIIVPVKAAPPTANPNNKAGKKKKTDDKSNVNFTPTTRKKKPFRTVEFERRVRILSILSKRQSDRDMPRAVFNTGVTTLAGIQGQEYIGLALLTIMALPGTLNDRVKEKQFATLLWRGISLASVLCQESIHILELDRVRRKIEMYVHNFVLVCGPQREIASPTVGCKIQRLHGLTHFPNQIQHFGSPQNFNGSYLESHLKTFVKHPAKRSRKTHNDFSHDLVNRWSEHASITTFISKSFTEENSERGGLTKNGSRGKRSHKGVAKFVIATETKQDDGVCARTSRSKFYFQLGAGNKWYTHTCSGVNNRGVVHPFTSLPSSYLRVLKRFLSDEMRPNNITTVHCHYELKIKQEEDNSSSLIMRCNPLYRAKPWFDWVNVDYSTSTGVESIASQIILWMSCKFNDGKDTIYGLVHSLNAPKTPRYNDVPFLRADTMYKEPKVVLFATSIAGPAYVLPGISRRMRNSIVDRPCGHDYLVVIPPRVFWHQIGWQRCAFLNDTMDAEMPDSDDDNISELEEVSDDDCSLHLHSEDEDDK